jgi:hypothetical protein
LNAASRSPILDLNFPHRWQAEILSARPLILPPRHFIYPRDAEEVERGALEVMIRPRVRETQPGAPGLSSETWERNTARTTKHPAQEFLATCALGFRDPAVPTGLWSAPNPDELCAVSGGYAYLIDTTAPERFTMLPFRPVLEVRSLPAQGLLLFVGHHAILAWGPHGEAWQSEKLSDEGVTISQLENGVLHGMGWQMMTDKELPFALDLATGLRI